MITQNELKKNLSYNPYTGIFVRLVGRPNSSKGDVAGTKNPQGYIIMEVNNLPYRAHRLAWLYMTGSFPKDQIDHINCIKSDNRFVNLREVTQSQNRFNTKKKKNNKLGIKGVHRVGNRFKAQAIFEKKHYYLGYYDTPKEASKVYQRFAKKFHGEFYFKGGY